MEGPPDVDSVRPIFCSDSSSDPSEENEKSDKDTKNLNGPQQHEPPTPIKPPEPQPPGVVIGGNRGLIMREKTSRKRTAYILEIRCTKSKKIQTDDADDGSSDTQVDIEVTDLGKKKQVNGFDHNEQAQTIFHQTVSSGSSPHSCNDTLTQQEIKTRMEQVNAELKTLRDEMDKRELKILHMFESFRESIKAESVPKVIEYKYLRPIKGKDKK